LIQDKDKKQKTYRTW